jgi:hypothetical protein
MKNHTLSIGLLSLILTLCVQAQDEYYGFGTVDHYYTQPFVIYGAMCRTWAINDNGAGDILGLGEDKIGDVFLARYSRTGQATNLLRWSGEEYFELDSQYFAAYTARVVAGTGVGYLAGPAHTAENTIDISAMILWQLGSSGDSRNALSFPETDGLIGYNIAGVDGQGRVAAYKCFRSQRILGVTITTNINYGSVNGHIVTNVSYTYVTNFCGALVATNGCFRATTSDYSYYVSPDGSRPVVVIGGFGGQNFFGMVGGNGMSEDSQSIGLVTTAASMDNPIDTNSRAAIWPAGQLTGGRLLYTPPGAWSRGLAVEGDYALGLVMTATSTNGAVWTAPGTHSTNLVLLASDGLAIQPYFITTNGVTAAANQGSAAGLGDLVVARVTRAGDLEMFKLLDHFNFMAVSPLHSHLYTWENITPPREGTNAAPFYYVDAGYSKDGIDYFLLKGQGRARVVWHTKHDWFTMSVTSGGTSFRLTNTLFDANTTIQMTTNLVDWTPLSRIDNGSVWTWSDVRRPQAFFRLCR